jgi:hypothetical protein
LGDEKKRDKNNYGRGKLVDKDVKSEPEMIKKKKKESKAWHFQAIRMG